MTRYVHHVPGRLRVRADVFRSDSGPRRRILRELSSIEGVHSVRLNDRASSVTVLYDGSRAVEQAVALLRAGEQRRARQTPSPVDRGTLSSDLAAQVGKATLSFLVNKGVTYSLSSLLGVRV